MSSKKRVHLHQFDIILYFFFHLPTYRETPMATTIRTCIYARGDVSFAKLVCQTDGVTLTFHVQTKLKKFNFSFSSVRNLQKNCCSNCKIED
jgi:hypothetical protein